MDKKFQIPKEFEPLEEILFCSNSLKNTNFIIDDDGFYPVLLGKGELPKVWIYGHENRNRIIPIIENNQPKLSKIKFDHFPKNKRINISVAGGEEDYTILDLHYNEIIEVVKIDLRPIGYNIFGNEEHLKVGEVELSNNNISGAKAFIGLGKQEEKAMA